ncbi:hypothetical protein ACNOYE_15180 [Nannocystaceae bacterium ST9]
MSAAELVATWQRIAAEAGPLRTLDPARELATPLPEVHARALVELPERWRATLAEPLAAGLIALALAQLDGFPGNLFWDLDLIACEVAREARAAATIVEARATIVDRFARMAELQALYGRASAINFSYVHDFVYGYDWVKWRARTPDVEHALPFGAAFLAHMQRRGHELLELIAHDDREYPKLADQRPRNPFPFSRAPADELRLHRELARRGLIPVPTWAASTDTRTIDAARPWQAERIELASGLGLSG